MRLFKTHSHASERPGCEERKNGANNAIKRNVHTMRKQTTHQKLPRTASVEGGWRRKRRYGETNHRQNPPAYRGRGGGVETKKGELKENTVAKRRETKVKPLLQATIVAGGGEAKGKNNHEMARCHNPRSREEGECLAENTQKIENKTTYITNKLRQNIQPFAIV